MVFKINLRCFWDKAVQIAVHSAVQWQYKCGTEAVHMQYTEVHVQYKYGTGGTYTVHRGTIMVL